MLEGKDPGRELVNNVEDARNAAMAEKPLRDAARRQGITPEGKIAFDQAAERKGQQTIDEIEKKKSFVGEGNVNGLMISMKWDDKLDRYSFSFPELPIDGQRINVVDPGVAKSVFDYACKIARGESDPFIILKEVAEFTRGLYND